jgi:hypothetical protein
MWRSSISVYSSPDPLRAFNDPCEQAPVTRSQRGKPGTVPILALSVPAYETPMVKPIGAVISTAYIGEIGPT